MDPFDPSRSSPDQPGGWAMPDSGAAAIDAPAWVAPESVADGSHRGDPSGTTAGRHRDDEPTAEPERASGPPRLPVPLRPMTTSDLLDGGFAILKNRPGAVFGATAVIIIPFVAFQAFLSRNIINGNSLNVLFSDPSASSSSRRGYSDADVFGAYAGQILGTMAVLFVGCVLARMVSAWYAGGDVSTADALKTAIKASPAIIVAWLVMLVSNGLSLVAGCIGWFFVNPLFLVVAPVIVIEGLGPLAAIRRSFQLVGRRYLWVVLYDLVATIMAYIATQALTVLPQLLAVALPPPWNWIALGVGQTVIAMIITPAVAGVAVLVYLDLRIRTEGLDIELQAAEAFASAA